MIGGETNALLQSLPSLEPAGSRGRESLLIAGACLHEVGDRVDYIYFPRSGLISLAVVMDDGRSAGTTLVGCEGAVGLSAIFGSPQAETRAQVLIGGAALRVPVGHVLTLFQEFPSLTTCLLSYQQSLIRRMNYLAACNVLHTLEQRLSCWLLTAHKRGNGQAIPITQEALANILGAHRASVNRVLRDFCLLGAITELRRGVIAITDQAALSRLACECSSVVQSG